nr:aldose 1-epimerase [Paludifilum halophilum]
MSFLQQQAVKAGNDRLEFVIVPEWGSNLISLVDQETESELLRVPRSAEEFWEKPVLFGIPILFPPNRIENGRFSYGGRDYQWDVNEEEHHNHIHGFVHTRKWKVIEAEADEKRVVVKTRFDSADYEEVTRQFPHPFSLTMTYVLEGSSLSKTAEVLNHGTDSFPLGLGFHTAFVFPEKTSLFSLTAQKRWRLNGRFLPTGQLEEIPYQEKLKEGMSLEGIALDDVFLSSGHDGGTNEAGLWIPASGIEIRYRVDSHFKHWVVYNLDGHHGFVCPEPYTWVTNAPNLRLPAELTGLQELAAGESKVFKTSITVLNRHEGWRDSP